MRIGFLGLGNMGTPMALRLIAAGHELSVWNRTEARTNLLAHEGAIVAGTPAEAELGADAVITMLWDDAAYEQVVFGANGLLDALSPGGLHISCSTISVALSQRLTVEYANRGIEFLAAPVYGGPRLAQEGRLWVVAGGTDPALNRARPLLAALSQGISVVGTEPSHAHAARLGGEFLLCTMVDSLSEAFAFAKQQGIEPELFFETVNNALFQSPCYATYARLMLHAPENTASTIELAAKDMRLLRQAGASRRTFISFADQIAKTLAEARRILPAGEDWAVALYRMAQNG